MLNKTACALYQSRPNRLKRELHEIEVKNLATSGIDRLSQFHPKFQSSRSNIPIGFYLIWPTQFSLRSFPAVFMTLANSIRDQLFCSPSDILFSSFPNVISLTWSRTSANEFRSGKFWAPLPPLLKWLAPQVKMLSTTKLILFHWRSDCGAVLILPISNFFLHVLGFNLYCVWKHRFKALIIIRFICLMN